ncbi:LysR family transcriptional regulator [soil metagenome]
MIDLGALRALIAVRDNGSVVAASESLGFTPSAVSQQIKRLERHTRSTLLERVGRRVILTEHGRLVAERGDRLFSDIESLESLALSANAPVDGTIRISSFSTAGKGLIAPLLARLRNTAPALHVTVIELDPWDALALVERGGADLAIVHNWNTVVLEIPASLDSATLLVDRVDVLMHRDHPLARAASLTPADLADEIWVATPRGTICNEGLVQLFSGAGFAANIAYYDGDFSTHIALVQHGVTTAFVPRLGRELLPDEVVAVEVVDPIPTRRVQAAWRHSTAANPALQHVRSELDRLIG